MNKYAVAIISTLILLLGCKKESSVVECNPPAATPKNILLIIMDDIGIEAMPGYPIGAIKPNMPNAQQMINDGVLFENAWSYPICSPTRASILTGRYGYRTNVLNVGGGKAVISNSELTLQAYLDQQLGKKYAHAIFGKWHLSDNDPNQPEDMGVDKYAGVLGGGVNDYDRWQFTENGSTSISTDYITTKLTDMAIDWIGMQELPWFCWMAYTAPHNPIHLPPVDMHSQGALPTDSASISNNPLPYFMAMIESLDHELGRIKASLSAEELANTTIILVGDNGTAGGLVQAPYTSNRSKGSLWQGGIHVPLIVSGAGVTRGGARENALVGTVDLFSTIAQIAGVESSSREDSESFFQLLSTPGVGPRSFNYSEQDDPNSPAKSGYVIRDAQYKLYTRIAGQEQFFDLDVDPYEANNLLDNTLSTQEQTALDALRAEAARIRQ